MDRSNRARKDARFTPLSCSPRQHREISSANSSLSASLEPRDWTQQAGDVTTNLLDASKYKSLSVYAEVKLAEALEKASKLQPDAVDEAGDLLPNSLKTAVCLQVNPYKCCYHPTQLL